LAVLGLFAEYAAERALSCIVDDEQWLDQSSVQVLAFVARRLLAESVGMVFAGRAASVELAGLPQLAVGNVNDADARALLDAAFVVPLDTILRDRIVAETRGNPLALVEVSQALASPEPGISWTCNHRCVAVWEDGHRDGDRCRGRRGDRTSAASAPPRLPSWGRASYPPLAFRRRQ